MKSILNEARRLQETYALHRDSEDATVRRKVHVDLDRFLMENRELAIAMMVNGLQPARRKWYEKRSTSKSAT